MHGRWMSSQQVPKTNQKANFKVHNPAQTGVSVVDWSRFTVNSLRSRAPEHQTNLKQILQAKVTTTNIDFGFKFPPHFKNLQTMYSLDSGSQLEAG